MPASRPLPLLAGAIALGLALVPGPTTPVASAHGPRSDPSGSDWTPPPSDGGDGTASPDPEAPPFDPEAPSASDQGPGDPSGSDPGAVPTPAAPEPSPVPGSPVPKPPIPKPHRPAHAISARIVHAGPLVHGRVAEVLATGKAAPPRSAPRAVKRLIWTANRLVGLPYKWGGGHVDFSDDSYDCSGAVSYALHAAGLLAYPEDSGTLMRWGRGGVGGWVTVYTNRGHAFLIVAGLRLDTSSVGDPFGGSGPRWRPAARPTDHFSARRPARL